MYSNTSLASSTVESLGALTVFEMAESTPCWQAHWMPACCFGVETTRRHEQFTDGVRTVVSPSTPSKLVVGHLLLGLRLHGVDVDVVVLQDAEEIVVELDEHLVALDVVGDVLVVGDVVDGLTAAGGVADHRRRTGGGDGRRVVIADGEAVGPVVGVEAGLAFEPLAVLGGVGVLRVLPVRERPRCWASSWLVHLDSWLIWVMIWRAISSASSEPYLTPSWMYSCARPMMPSPIFRISRTFCSILSTGKSDIVTTFSRNRVPSWMRRSSSSLVECVREESVDGVLQRVVLVAVLFGPDAPVGRLHNPRASRG